MPRRRSENLLLLALIAMVVAIARPSAVVTLPTGPDGATHGAVADRTTNVRALERELQCHVHLALAVKVRRHWRGDERLLDRLGIE